MQTTIRFPGLRRFWVPLIALVIALAPPRAEAVLLEYTFTGIAGASSGRLTLGGEIVDLAGAPFTVTGRTVSDVNVLDPLLIPEGLGGIFAATSVYDFGPLGSFTTDPGTDYYLQLCFDPVNRLMIAECVGLAGLTVLVGGGGFLVLVDPAVPGNPNFGVPLGTLSVSDVFFLDTRIWFNQDGTALGLGGEGGAITSATVTAAIPEPASLALFGLGFAVLLARSRRLERLASSRAMRKH